MICNAGRIVSEDFKWRSTPSPKLYLRWWWRVRIRGCRDWGWRGFLRLLQWVIIYTFVWATAVVTVASFFTPLFFLFLLFLFLSLTQPAEFLCLFLFPALLQFSPAFLISFLPFTDGVGFTVTVEKKQTSLLQYVLQDSQCSTGTKESPETLHLSLSEDDEGARLTGAGFGFRTRGFGAGFSAGGKNNHWAH